MHVVSAYAVIFLKIMMNDPPNYRPVPPQSHNEQTNDLLALMKECWADSPNERPAFTEIAKVLRHINKGQYVYPYYIIQLLFHVMLADSKICSKYNADWMDVILTGMFFSQFASRDSSKRIAFSPFQCHSVERMNRSARHIKCGEIECSLVSWYLVVTGGKFKVRWKSSVPYFTTLLN